MDTYHIIKDILADGGIAVGEARAIALMLLDELGGMSQADVLMGREPRQADRIVDAARRVAAGEPVQYVTGCAHFCGLTLRVAPGVLIPRPETEELVRIAAAARPGRILDIGTGSGCIAVALARLLPQAEVVAVDVSDEALRMACGNAAANGVDVRFVRCDILSDDVAGQYDLVVSNPPYICRSEAADMERNVLDHEPHLALFVPDSDPLLFYRRIADVALRTLSPGGMLAFETNRAYGADVAAMLSGKGFAEVGLRQDQYGNDRFVTAIKRRPDSLL